MTFILNINSSKLYALGRLYAPLEGLENKTETFLDHFETL